MFDFEEILNPITKEEFTKDYWPTNYLVSPTGATNFINLDFMKKFNSIESIIDVYKNPIMVVGKPIIEHTEGIANKMLVSPENALDWYEKGASLELDAFQLFVPELNNYLKELKKFLNLPSGTMNKAIVYAAKNGGGFPAHIDSYTNFIFQIKGHKTWKLLQNTSAPLPLIHYEVQDYPFKPSLIKNYWEGLPPEEELTDANVEVLEPGNMLYLPRGIWHSTNSQEETLAINFTFAQPTWIDLCTNVLKEELSKEQYMRQLVDLDNFDQSKILQALDKSINKISREVIIEQSKNDYDIYQQTQNAFRSLLIPLFDSLNK